MARRATASTRVGDSTAKKGAPKRGAASKTNGGKSSKKGKSPSKPTIASVSAKLDALGKDIAEQVAKDLAKRFDALEAILQRALAAKTTALEDDGVEDHAEEAETAQFDRELRKVLAELDRRGRHDGMVPIPEVREAFLVRGWTRRSFDDRLLRAERDFVVDLKTADDPKRLAEPHLAIRERGRGHLQYVVVR